MITRCLAIIGGGSVGECDRLSQHSFWVHDNVIVVLAYLAIVTLAAFVHYLHIFSLSIAVSISRHICTVCGNATKSGSVSYVNTVV